MIIWKALSKNAEGNFEIDMHVVRKLASEFDSGSESDECYIAKFIMAAFQCGFDAGVEETEQAHQRMALLLLHTQGNA